MKKLLLPLLIVLILFQLAAPAYMVWEKYDTLETGSEYKFEVEIYDAYDTSAGRQVTLMALEQRRFYNYPEKTFDGSYGLIEIDEAGFAKITQAVSAKPSTDYIKSTSNSYFELPINRYYLDRDLSPDVQDLLFKSPEKLRPYVTLMVKGDKAVIAGLYIDGIRIEDYTLHS